MVTVTQGKSFTKAPKANKLGVLVGVSIALIIAGLPLMSKKVYQREQDLAAMRDAKYGDAGSFKDESRQQRLSIKRGTSVE